MLISRVRASPVAPGSRVSGVEAMPMVSVPPLTLAPPAELLLEPVPVPQAARPSAAAAPAPMPKSWRRETGRRGSRG